MSEETAQCTSQQPDPRPRVLHLTQPVDGGVARVVTDLARAQLAAGLHVTVACPAGGALAAGLRALGADVRPWPATRSPGPGARRARCGGSPGCSAQVRPDLVHAHSAKAGLAGRLACGGGSRPCSSRTPGPSRRSAAPPPRSRCAGSGAGRAGPTRTGVRERGRAHDRRARRGRRAGGASSPTASTPSASTPPPSDTVRAGSPQLAGVDPAAPLVVCVGRLCRQKGQDVLLRAWDAVAARVPEARLVLVGDGPDRGRDCARARRGRCCSPGPSPTPCPGTRPPTWSCCPRAGRAWRWPRWRRMACGRPVVLTDVDGARESLPPALAPRCLVPADDPTALADAVAAAAARPAAARVARPSGAPARPGHARRAAHGRGGRGRLPRAARRPSSKGRPSRPPSAGSPSTRDCGKHRPLPWRAATGPDSRPSRSSRAAASATGFQVPGPPAVRAARRHRCRCCVADGLAALAGALALSGGQRRPLLAALLVGGVDAAAPAASRGVRTGRPRRTARRLRPDRGRLAARSAAVAAATTRTHALSAAHAAPRLRGTGRRPAARPRGAVHCGAAAGAVAAARAPRWSSAPPTTAQRVAAAVLRHPRCGVRAGRRSSPTTRTASRACRC